MKEPIPDGPAAGHLINDEMLPLINEDIVHLQGLETSVTLMLEADMVDARSFSEGQIENRIEAFMELLKT